MARLWIGIIAPSVLTAGCATGVPALPFEDSVPVAQVVKAVQCEMKDAIARVEAGDKRRDWLDDWTAGYTLTLNVSEVGAARISAAVPIAASFGSVGLGLGGAATRTSKRIAIMNYSVSVKDAKRFACSPGDVPESRTLLPGRLGIAEWLQTAIEATDPPGPESSTTPRAQMPDSVGHTFEFALSLTADGSPAFSIARAAGAAVVTPALHFERDDDDALAVTFNKGKSKTVEVSVSNRRVLRRPKNAAAIKATIERLEAEKNRIRTMDVNPEPKLMATERRIETLKQSLRPRYETEQVVRKRTQVEANPALPGVTESLQQLQLERLLGSRRFSP